MDIVGLLITLIVIIAVVAIFWWFLKASGIPIPQPVQIALWAVVAILAILFVARFAGLGRVW